MKTVWRVGLAVGLLASLLACGGRPTAVRPAPPVTKAQAPGIDLGATAQAAASQVLAVVGTSTGLEANALATAQAGGGTAMVELEQAAATATVLAGTAVSLAATGQAVLGTLSPATVAPADAQQVIQTYAQQVLGLTVTSVAAGGRTTVNQTLNLPPSAQASQAQAENVAIATYAALLPQGAASVSYGSGTLSGDVTVDLQAASLGAFSLLVDGRPETEAEALNLALAAYPGLAGRVYDSVGVPRGYAWSYQGQTPGYSWQAGQFQAQLVAEAITLNLQPSGRQSLVSVVVGRGTLASTVQWPGK